MYIVKVEVYQPGSAAIIGEYNSVKHSKRKTAEKDIIKALKYKSVKSAWIEKTA